MSSLELCWQERWRIALPLPYNQDTIIEIPYNLDTVIIKTLNKKTDPFSNFLKSILGLKYILIQWSNLNSLKVNKNTFQPPSQAVFLKSPDWIFYLQLLQSQKPLQSALVNVKPHFIPVNDQLTSFSAHWGSILMTQLFSRPVMGQLIEGSSRGWGKAVLQTVRDMWFSQSPVV